MSRLAAAIACLSILAPALAHADTAAPPSTSPPAAPARSAPLAAALVGPLPPRKDPGVALGLSLGITAGGMALMAIGGGLDSELGGGLATVGALGALVGPTTGHAYAGTIGNPGLAVRAASTLVGTIAIGGIIGCIGDNLEGHEDLDDDDCGGWALLLVVSSLTYVGGAVHEIADAPRAARRYNARHGSGVHVAPTVVGGDGNRAPGVVLAGHF